MASKKNNDRLQPSPINAANLLLHASNIQPSTANKGNSLEQRKSEDDDEIKRDTCALFGNKPEIWNQLWAKLTLEEKTKLYETGVEIMKSTPQDDKTIREQLAMDRQVEITRRMMLQLSQMVAEKKQNQITTVTIDVSEVVQTLDGVFQQGNDADEDALLQKMYSYLQMGFCAHNLFAITGPKEGEHTVYLITQDFPLAYNAMLDLMKEMQNDQKNNLMKHNIVTTTLPELIEEHKKKRGGEKFAFAVIYDDDTITNEIQQIITNVDHRIYLKMEGWGG